MFTDYVIDYTLEKFCHNSREEYAGELGIPVSELNRLLNRVKRGERSPRLVNMTMELYAKRADVLHKVAQEYEKNAPDPAPQWRACYYEMDMLRAQMHIADRYECIAHEKRLAHMYTCVRDLVHAVESTLCGKNSQHFPTCIHYTQTESSSRKTNARPCHTLEVLAKQLGRSTRCPGKSE